MNSKSKINMKILFDITHPGHVHLFKNTLWNLGNEGHEILVTTLDKDVTIKLLEIKLELSRFWFFVEIILSKDFLCLFLIPVIVYGSYYFILTRLYIGDYRLKIKRSIPLNLVLATKASLIAIIFYFGFEYEYLYLFLAGFGILILDTYVLNIYGLSIDRWNCIRGTQVDFNGSLINLARYYCPYQELSINRINSRQYSFSSRILYVFSIGLYFLTLVFFLKNQV